MILNVSRFPEQMLRDKLARNMAWTVTQSKLDLPNERFVFEIALNAHDTTVKYITFSEACQMMGWKSFEFAMDYQLVLPVVDEELLLKDQELCETLYQKACKDTAILSC